MKKRNFLRLLSLVLCITVSMASFPIISIANDDNNKGDNLSEKSIVKEMTDYRDEYTKVYRREDGTYVALAFDSSLKMISDGQYQMTLVPSLTCLQNKARQCVKPPVI